MSIEVLASKLTAVDKAIAATKYPAIVFPEFVTVDQSAAIGATEKVHYGSTISGSLDDGIVGDNTNTLDTVSVAFQQRKTPIVDWMKVVRYSLIELERCKILGVDIDTQKIMALNKNAMQTLQKVAFLGHGRDGRLKGLLNGEGVEVVSADTAGIVTTKPVDKMTFAEAVEFFESMFKFAISKTKHIDTPNMLVIDAGDLAHLAFLTRTAGDATTALEFLTKNLEAAAGQPVKIKAAPANYAAVVPMTPRTIPVFQKGAVDFETGLRMAFGGVVFKEPESALYVDYKAEAEAKGKK